MEALDGCVVEVLLGPHMVRLSLKSTNMIQISATSPTGEMKSTSLSFDATTAVSILLVVLDEPPKKLNCLFLDRRHRTWLE